MYPYICFYAPNKYNEYGSILRFNAEGVLIELKYSSSRKHLIALGYDWCTKNNCCIFTMN